MKKQTRNSIIFGIILVTLLVIMANNGLLKTQSVVAISTVPFEQGGKAYWLISSVGDSIDEGFSFTYNVGDTVKDYTLSNGSTVQPKQSMSLFFSKKDSKCDYSLIKQTRSLFLGIYHVDYYILSNPSRIALIDIKDSNGKMVTINGAINGDSKTITDTDGSGKVVIKSLGLISDSQDCPNYENVAVVFDGNNVPKIVYKSDYEEKLNSIGGLSFLNIYELVNYLFGNVNINSQFTSAFDSYPTINMVSPTLTGKINIGSGFFTITADQDYFDSVLYTPPKQAKPSISSIYTSSIKSGDTASIRVDVQNLISDTGIVNLYATSKQSSIYPGSTQFVLSSGIVSKYFTITAGNVVGTGEVCFEVCSTSQFEQNYCDSKCKTFSITAEEPASICGDSVCQSNENNATCPKDCLISDMGILFPKCDSCDDFALSKLIGPVLKSKQCEARIIALPPQTIYTCIFSFIKLILVPIVLIFGTLFSLELLSKFKSLKGKKKGILRLVISLVLGLLVAFLVYYTFWVGMVLFAVYLIFIILKKSIIP